MRRAAIPGLFLLALLLALGLRGGPRAVRSPPGAPAVEDPGTPEPGGPGSPPEPGPDSTGNTGQAPETPMRPVVRGSVTAPDGSVLPEGFTVYIYWKYGRYASPLARRSARIVRTFPAGAHEFEIPTGRVGRFLIAAESPGRVAASSEILAGFSERSAPPVAIALAPEVVLAGMVFLEPEGLPANGVRISVSRESEQKFPFDADRTETGPDGSFRISGIPAGTWNLTARIEGRVPFEETGIRLGAGEEWSGIRIDLIVGGRIEGMVKTTDGKPMTGVSLVVVSADGRRESERTASDGRYAFEQLTPGYWRLGVEEADGEWMEVSARATIRRDIVLPAPCILRVEVCDGEVLLRSGPIFVRLRGSAWSEKKWWAHNGPGLFLLPPGEYELWVSGRSRSITLAPGEERLETFQFDAGVIEGHVIHESDGKGRKARVFLARVGLPEPLARWREPQGTRRDGSFRITDLPPGEYVIGARFGPTETEEVRISLAPGETISNLVLTIRE